MPLTQYRTGRNFPIFLGWFFLAWTLRATVLYRVDETLPEGAARQTYALFTKVLLWIVPAVLFAVAIRGDRPRDSLRLGWPDFSHGLGRMLLVALGSLVVMAWDVTRVHHGNFSDLGDLLLQHGFAAAVWALPTAFVEEAFFRGLVLTELTERLRTWAANTVTALLFVAVHWPHWLWTRGLDVAFLRDSVGVFIVGFIAGYLTRLTRSIWPAAVWHAATLCLTGVW